MNSEGESTNAVEFDRRLARSAGLGEADFLIPSHDAPPVFTSAVIATLKFLEDAGTETVPNGSNGHGGNNGHGNGSEGASS